MADLQNYILGKLKGFQRKALSGVEAFTNPLPPPVNVLQDFKPQNPRQQAAFDQSQSFVQGAQQAYEKPQIQLPSLANNTFQNISTKVNQSPISIIPKRFISGGLFGDTGTFGSAPTPATFTEAFKTGAANRGKILAENFDISTPEGALNIAGIVNPVAKVTKAKPVLKGAVSGLQKIGKEAVDASSYLSRAQEGIHDAYTRGVDRFHPIVRLATKAGKKKTIEEALSGYYGIGSKAQYHLDYELKPLFKGVDAKDLRNYTIANRDIELAGRAIKGSSKKQGEKILSELQSKSNFPQIQEAAQKLYAFQDSIVRQYLVDTGVISQQAYDAMRARNQAYIPFKRIMDTVDESLGISGAPGSVSNQNVIKGIKGSNRKIQDPLESIVENVYKIVSLGQRQKVAQTIASLDSSIPGVIKKISAPLRDKDSYISVFENGKKQYYQVPKDVMEAAKGMNEEQLNLIIQIASAPSRLLRATATTLNPDFIVPNVARDMQSAYINAGVNPLEILNSFRKTIGVHLLGKDDALYKEFLQAGGLTSRISQDKPAIKRTVGELTANTPKKLLALLNPLKAFKNIQTFAQISEEATRRAVYERTLNKALQKGLSRPDAMKEAAYMAQEASTNFARRGSAMKAANSLIPFLNARIQGVDRLVRTGIKNPGATAFRVGVLTIPPTLATYAYNRTFPEYFDENVVPEYKKKDNFILMAPWLGKNRYITIPKGDVGQLANPIEEFLSYADGKGGEVAKAVGEALLAFSPVQNIGDVVPTAIKPPIEAALNKSLFTGYELVPEYKKGFPKYKQDQSSTEPTYRALGAATNQSPSVLQNTIRGYGSGVVRLGEQIINPLLPEHFKTDRNSQGDPINKVPVVRRLVGGEVKTKEEAELSEQKRQQAIQFELNDITSGVKRGELTPEEGQAAMQKILGQEQQKVEKPSLLTDKAGASEGAFTLNGKEYIKTPSGEYKAIDIQSIVNMPSDTAYEKQLKRDEAFKVLDDIEGLSVAQTTKYLEKIGITKEEAEYYNIASASPAARIAYISDELQGVPQEKFMETLAQYRKDVNGKRILTNDGVDALFNEGVISTAEKKYLKSVTFNKKSGALKTGTGKKKKPKRITVKRVSIKAPKVAFKKPRKARYRTLKPVTIKVSQSKKIPMKVLKTNKLPTQRDYKKLFGV